MAQREAPAGVPSTEHQAVQWAECGRYRAVCQLSVSGENAAQIEVFDFFPELHEPYEVLSEEGAGVQTDGHEKLELEVRGFD